MSDVYEELNELEAQSAATQVPIGELTVNRPYSMSAVEATRHPDIGRGVRAFILQNTRFVFFTGRFRMLSDVPLAAINADITAGRPPALLRDSVTR